MSRKRAYAVPEIFALLDGPASVGRIIGVSTTHATLMRRRGSIPAKYWPTIVAYAEANGIKQITCPVILAAHFGVVEKPKRGRARARSR